mgnify:CR=1 FL=1
MLQHDIFTAKELLAHDDGHQAIKEHWKWIVQSHYDKLAREISFLRKRRDSIKEDLDVETLLMEVEDAEADVPANRSTPAAVDKATKPAGFSNLFDPIRFNARVVSKNTTNRINMNDFQRRKSLQEAKMQSVKASIWKMDWSHKLPKKIKVHTGKGECFAPYKALLTVQNEDALTIFWKFYDSSESIETCRKDLTLLKQRNEMLPGEETLRVVCVDNCCVVRPKIQSIVGEDVEVKCDIFHWCQRWDEIMYDLTAEKTSIFRQLMRRAVFVTENLEIERVKAQLLKKKKLPPTIREIMKEAKATVPPPAELEKRVMAVLHALMEKDLQDDMKLTIDSTRKPDRFFKAGAQTSNVIVNQTEHVKKGCLSDPSDEVVQIHRCNPRTGKTFTGRGTGTNEVDNRCLNCLLDTPSVGLTRADRIIHDCYEKSNENKLINRLGKEPEFTAGTEQLQMLQGLAHKCGFPDFPMKNASYPVNLDNLKETIGFEYHLPDAFIDTPVEEAVDDDDDDVECDEMAEFLDGLNFDGDVPVDGAPTAGQQEGATEESEQEADFFGDDIEVNIDIFVPVIQEHESTYVTFAKRTQQAPWVPFRHPRLAASFSSLDKAEHKLFDEMEGLCDRNCKRLDSARGYKRFEKAWDLHVANTLWASLNGEDVQLINQKSCIQLQQHFDNLQKQKELLALNSSNDPELKRVEEVFRQTRRQMAPHQSAATCDPAIQYNRALGAPQFGVPMALNTTIAANAFAVTTANSATPITFNRNVHVPTRKAIARSTLGKDFRYSKCCWRCGFQKKIHIRSGMRFGDHCRGNCGYEQCSKCGERVGDCHEIGYIGPHCPNATSPSTAEHVADWWKMKGKNTCHATRYLVMTFAAHS